MIGLHAPLRIIYGYVETDDDNDDDILSYLIIIETRPPSQGHGFFYYPREPMVAMRITSLLCSVPNRVQIEYGTIKRIIIQSVTLYLYNLHGIGLVLC